MSKSFLAPIVFCTSLLIVAGPTAIARSAEKKIPIIHYTDLLHPHDDPDDHYDLACLFALDEFDVKGIVLDSGRDPLGQVKHCGRPAIEQMMQITGRKVPYAIGLNRQLRSPNDKRLDGERRFQAGVELILSLLRNSDEPMVFHASGSMRDLAAAFNREPDLLKRKLKAVYVEAGRGPSGVQREWNVTLDPFAFVRVIESGLPVYWCPCFGTDGYQTYFKADQAAVVGACSPAVQNFFVYCLIKSKADPIAFLKSGPHPLPTGERNMWCTAPLLHAAGRKIYRRGPDDYVALAPADAAKSGLSDNAVEVCRFVPMRATVSRMPELAAKGKKPVLPELNVILNPPDGANCFIFHSTGPNYQEVLPSALKNLLSGLGR